MEFIKKHYEKIILSVVMAGLAAATVVLSIQAGMLKDSLNEIVNSIKSAPPNTLTPVDMKKYQASVERVKNPPTLELARTNLVFNPVRWVRDPKDGKLKSERTNTWIGVGALKIIKTSPLNFIVSLDSTSQQNETWRYQIGVRREAAPLPQDRGVRRTTAAVGQTVGKKDTGGMLIKEAKGVGDEAELQVEIYPDNETFTVTKAVPFKRIGGYTVDLLYPLDNTKYTTQRIGARLKLEGHDYIIIDIKENEVILEADSNKKRYSITDRVSP